MSNFHPLEVVGRVSETQLTVAENLKNGEEKGNMATIAFEVCQNEFMSHAMNVAASRTPCISWYTSCR